jgi:hypothetical protein
MIVTSRYHVNRPLTTALFSFLSVIETHVDEPNAVPAKQQGLGMAQWYSIIKPNKQPGVAVLQGPIDIISAGKQNECTDVVETLECQYEPQFESTNHWGN